MTERLPFDPNASPAEVVLADMFVAAHDNRGQPITRRDAERLAADVLELLAVAGYHLTRQEHP